MNNNISLSPWKKSIESGQADMGMVKQGQAIKCNRSNLHLTVNNGIGVAGSRGQTRSLLENEKQEISEISEFCMMGRYCLILYNPSNCQIFFKHSLK